MLYLTVLVTGCGGDIGLGIGKILKMSGVAGSVVGCDIHSEHPAPQILDGFDIVLRAGTDGYFESMREVINKRKVGLVIPTTEPELRFLAENRLLDEMEGVPLVTANLKALETGLDKLATAELLKANGMPYPWTKLVTDGPPPELPCIIKDRHGYGSKSIGVVEEGFAGYYAAKHPDGIWQEYLRPDDEEYTCGVYRSNDGETRVIAIKRRLQGGFTYYGEVVENTEIDALLVKLAGALDLRGSINAQLRLTGRGPVIFEINPRFSSTVVFRHMMGYRDLIWSVMEKAGRPLEPYTPPAAGTRFFRGSQEYILK